MSKLGVIALVCVIACGPVEPGPERPDAKPLSPDDQTVRVDVGAGAVGAPPGTPVPGYHWVPEFTDADGVFHAGHWERDR